MGQKCKEGIKAYILSKRHPENSPCNLKVEILSWHKNIRSFFGESHQKKIYHLRFHAHSRSKMDFRPNVKPRRKSGPAKMENGCARSIRRAGKKAAYNSLFYGHLFIHKDVQYISKWAQKQSEMKIRFQLFLKWIIISSKYKENVVLWKMLFFRPFYAVAI